MMHTHLRKTVLVGVAVTAATLLATDTLLAQPGGGGRRDRQQQTDQPGGRDRQQTGQPQRRGNPGGRMQGRGRGFNMSFEPDISSKDLDEMTRLLNLSEDQKAAVYAMFSDYQQAFNEAVAKPQADMERRMEEMRDGRGMPDRSSFLEMAEVMTAWRVEKSKLEKAFFDDAKLLVDERQMERWGGFERARRRDRSLPNGRMSAEDLDLIDLVEGMEMPQSVAAELMVTLGEYELELDRALAERDDVMPELEEQITSQMAEGYTDAALKIYKEIGALRRNVQEVNRRYSDRLAALMPAAQQAEFSQVVMQRSYPWVFEHTRADEAIDAVSNLPNLTPSQRESLAGVQGRFMEASALLRDQAIRDINKAEQEGSPPPWLDRDREEGGRRQLPPQFAMRLELRELEADTVRHIRDLLTTEQIEELPREVLETRRRRGDWGGRDRQQRDRPQRGRDGT